MWKSKWEGVNTPWWSFYKDALQSQTVLLPPLQHWWVPICTSHSKWKLSKNFLFPIKVLQPWPRLSCSICESTLQFLQCVCPQLCRRMAGEGTLHQGDAFSTRAGNELQEHYLPVLPCTRQHMITLVAIFVTCWAAHVKGAVQVSMAVFMDMWSGKNEWEWNFCNREFIFAWP